MTGSESDPPRSSPMPDGNEAAVRHEFRQVDAGAQGGRLGRRGRVHIERAVADIWVGGATTTIVTGRLALA